MLLDGLALLTTDGHAAAATTLRGAAEVLSGISIEDVLRWGFIAPSATLAVWDLEGFHAIAARQVQLVREAGALTHLPQLLNHVGMACAWMGDFAGAEALIAESDSVAEATGSPIGPYTLLRLRALQGREADASAAIAGTIAQAETEGQEAARWAHWAAAVLYNGLGRYREAASAARRATSDPVYPWPATWALPELVEAAARGGDAELARDALGRLMESTQPFTTASGCDARIAASTREHRSAPPTSSSPRSAWRRSPSARVVSCWPRARRSASERSRRATT
jgi:hypothetical protein